MRPIDADELDKALAKECEDCIHNQYDCEECDFLIARLYVNAAPTIEAEPVKHGRWIVSHTQKHVEVTYECSECQHEVVGEYEKTPFCGECGARMDGDGDE